MKNIRIIIILLISLFSCKTIDWKLNEVDYYTNKKNDLVGLVDRPVLLRNKKMNECFTSYFTSYEPDQVVLEQVKKNISGVRIVTFFGSWCSDSQEQLPLFYKVLETVSFDQSRHKVVALNRNKHACGLQRYQNIERVPTFIVLKDNKEIGRIIEKPKPNSTLEKELLEILVNR